MLKKMFFVLATIPTFMFAAPAPHFPLAQLLESLHGFVRGSDVEWNALHLHVQDSAEHHRYHRDHLRDHAHWHLRTLPYLSSPEMRSQHRAYHQRMNSDHRGYHALVSHH